MKHDTFAKYRAQDVHLPERALLTAWDSLCAYHGDLVLAGGLAIKYLTTPPASGLPGPVTLDVDFAINMAASAGSYGSIRESLAGHGFSWSSSSRRFVRKYRELDLYIDLITDNGTPSSGTIIVDDSLPVSCLPGINNALENYRNIEISGSTLVGAESTQTIRVAEVGPMLALKLNAFGGPEGRKAPKDAHDILYLAMNYLDGTETAIEAFHTEKHAGNMAMAHAESALQEYFLDPEAEGPMACAAFRLGEQHLSAEHAEASLLIRTQCMSLAEQLLGV